jgi:hypothetical protein
MNKTIKGECRIYNPAGGPMPDGYNLISLDELTFDTESAAKVSDTAYDASTWDSVTDIAPSKNAVRDKLNTMDTAIGLNTAKTTNATHTGEVTGATTLTIAANAVTTAKILNANVTAAKLAPGVFTNAYGFRGIPALADDNWFVTTANMKATAYTIANAAPVDSLCRNITITHTTVDVADTLTGGLVITGTNFSDEVITETIAVTANSTTTGTKAFKTVTEIIGAGWIIGGSTADTIIVGTGGLIGLSFVPSNANKFLLGTLGTGIINAPTVAVGATIETCTINCSSGTYDGSKALVALFNV